MAAGYAELLRTRHAARLLAGTLGGRLPNATAALAVVLFVRAEGGSYALAGALSAVYGVCNAIGQPLLGRAVDLYGQPRVMLPASVLSALGMALLAAVGLDVLWLAYAAMVIAGFFTPPLEGGLRALWPGVLQREDRVHAAYALDAVAQEVMFAVGPLLVTLCVAAWSEGVALLVINLIGVLGALSVVVSGPSRRWRSGPREAHWLGALRSAGLLVLIGAFFFVGLAVGSIAVAAVAYADEHGGGMVSSALLSALGVGALVSGLVYGAREWPGRPEKPAAAAGRPAGTGVPAAGAGAGRRRHDGADRCRRCVPGAAGLRVRGGGPACAQGHGDGGVFLAGDDVRRGVGVGCLGGGSGGGGRRCGRGLRGGRCRWDRRVARPFVDEAIPWGSRAAYA